ncbi:MAG: RluA family pseudouridine synthase [Dehalococcoidia bacterium]|nr:RluA family pseudouridine synthase [Dehalococcoidia bacterium]
MNQRMLLTADIAGLRLDVFIAQHLPRLSRSFIQKLITDGYVLLDDKPVRAGLKLKVGNSISVTVPPPAPCDIVAEDIPIHIIYEDDDLLVVNKPHGMTTHPAPGSMSHTLVNAVLAHLPVLPESDSPARPGIVHRLDKDTSGLILIAKTSSALASLSAQFKSRTVKKAYMALVRGKLKLSNGVIDAPIGRDRTRRQRMTIDTIGRPARTSYTVLEQFHGYTLLEARPETGRTHQIRVHLASIGHSVVGDVVYGSKSELVGRQFLHAIRLSFMLPTTKEIVEFTAPLPSDLQIALENLRNSSCWNEISKSYCLCNKPLKLGK